MVFINDFLTIGMNDYFNTNNSSFERHIVECLCDIYGREKIKALYESNDVNEFEKTIHEYGLKPNIYDNFLNNTKKFEEFKIANSANPSLKSDIASIVETNIISMFLYKCLIESPSMEELGHFENNLLNDFSIIKMHFNISTNPNRTREYWNEKKKILSNNSELIEFKPDYLDEFTYARFGIRLEDVEKMDYRMVQELNTYILEKTKEESETNQKSKRRFVLGNTVLTSGNGYTDALLIISIIITELSIGAIYLFLHM